MRRRYAPDPLFYDRGEPSPVCDEPTDEERATIQADIDASIDEMYACRADGRVLTDEPADYAAEPF